VVETSNTPASEAEQKERLRITVSEAIGETRKVGQVRKPTIRSQVDKAFKGVESKVAELKKKYGDNKQKTFRVWRKDPVTGREYSERVTISQLEREVKSAKQEALARGLEQVQATTTVEEARPRTPGEVIRAAEEAAKAGPLGTPDLTPAQQTEFLDILVSQRLAQKQVGAAELARLRESPAAQVYFKVSEAQQKAASFVEENLVVKENVAGRFIRSTASGLVQAPFTAVKLVPGAVAGLEIAVKKPGVIVPALIVAGRSTIFSFKARPAESAGQVVGTYLGFKGIEAAINKLSKFTDPTTQLKREGIPGEIKGGRYVRGSIEQELTSPFKLEQIRQSVEVTLSRGKPRAAPITEYVYRRPVSPYELYQTVELQPTTFSSFIRDSAPRVTLTPPSADALAMFEQIKQIYGPDLAGRLIENVEKEGGVLGYSFRTIQEKSGKFTGMVKTLETEIGTEAGGIGAGGIPGGPALRQISRVTILPGGKRITVSRTIGQAAAAGAVDLLADIDVGGGISMPGGGYPVSRLEKLAQATITKPKLKVQQARAFKQPLATKQSAAVKRAMKLQQKQAAKTEAALRQVTGFKQDLSLKQGIAVKTQVSYKLATSLKTKQRLSSRTVLKMPASMKIMRGGDARTLRKTKIGLPKYKRGRIPRTFLAFPDPLSAWESQIKYGKFTAPPQTRKLRTRYRKEVLFSPLTPRFPTLEQLRAPKKRRKKRKASKKKRAKKINTRRR